MSTLTGNQIRNTYDSLLKLEDNDGLNANKKKVTDGLGNETPLSISETEVVSTVNVEASGFKTPTGTSSQVLLADGSTTTLDVGSTQEIFKNVAVSGQSTIVADSNNDTLTFVEGSNVTITTDDTTDSITIASSYVDTTYTAGGGLDLVGTEFSHSDTSSATNLTATSRTYVDGLTFDDYGHVTGYTTATETVVDNDTTYTAGAGLDLTGTVFSHEDTSSVADLTPSSRTYVDGITFDDYGHVQSISTSSETLTGTVDGTGTANYVAKWSDADTITDSVIYDDGSNVGIGTDDPQGQLEVSGTNPIIVLKDSGGATDKKYRYFQNNDNKLYFSRANDAFDSFSSDLVIAADGKVGIGLTNPSVPLHVDGFARLNGGLQLNTSNAIINQIQNSALRFGTNNTERMRIDSDGNVGIGTTSPGYNLEVSGDTYTSGKYVSDTGEIMSLYQSNWTLGATHYVLYNAWKANVGDYIMLKSSGNQSGSNGAILVADGNSGGRTYFGLHANNSPANDNALTPLDSTYAFIGASDTYFSSDVGIGTTSPSEELHISSSNPGVRLQDSDGTNTFGRVHFTGSTLQYYSRNNTSNGIHAWYGSDGTANTEFMRLQNDGQLRINEYGSGIFTGTATQRLGVDSNGNVIEIPIGSGAVDGSGTANTLAMWSDADTIADAPITVSGNDATFTGDLTVSGGDITLSGTGRIQGIDTVTDNTDAANKLYVDNAITTATGDYLPLAGGTMTGNLKLNDNVQLQVGSSADLQILHDASDSFLINNTGDLYLRNLAEDKDIIFQSDDGLGGITEYFKLDGSLADGTWKYTKFPDNSVIALGDATYGDLQLFHDDGQDNSYISNYTGELIIANYADDKDVIFRSDDGSGGTAVYFKLDGSLVNGTTTLGAVNFPDKSKLFLGTNSDLQIFHDGSDSWIRSNGTGDLYFEQRNDDKDILFRSDNGSGGLATYFFLDGGSVATQFNQRALFVDNIAAEFGSSRDLKIYHDGSDSYIQDAGTGSLKILAQDFDLTNAAGTASMIRAIDGAQAELYYGGSKKLETTSAGVEVTGEGIFTGNVGIGTDSPKQLFHVHGGSTTGSVTKAVIGGTGGNGESYLYLAENFSGDNVNYGFSFVADGNSSNNLLIKRHSNSTSGNTVITVNRDNDNVTFSGDVGIGVSPSQPLDVNGTALIRNTIYVGDDIQHWGDGGTGMYFGTDTISLKNDGGSTRLFVESGGNVGIGTDDPDVKLEINGGADAIAKITGTTTAARFDYETNSHHRFWQLIESDGRFRFYDQTNTSERLTINSSGKVGIGENNPSQKLHVDGNARVTGAIYDSSNSSGTSGQVLSSTATGTSWVDATAGDITGVEAGDGLTGGGNSGDVTIDINYSGTDNAILAATDASGSDIGTNAKIWYSADGSIAYANVSDLPFGAGDVDGSGVAGAMTKWTDADTIEDSDFMTESASGIQIGTDALTYLHSSKRIGIGTASPSVAFDCAGAAKFQSSFYDGSNNLASAGKVLTGTAVGECLWADASSLAYRENKTFYFGWKVSTSATEFFRHTTSGASSLGYETLMPVPYDGTLEQIVLLASANYSNISIALVDYSGAVIYSSGTISLTANTAYTLAPNASISKSSDRSVALRIIRPTASNNGEMSITATYEWDN